MISDSERLSNKSGNVSKSSRRVSQEGSQIFTRGHLEQVKVSRKTFRYVSDRKSLKYFTYNLKRARKSISHQHKSQIYQEGSKTYGKALITLVSLTPQRSISNMSKRDSKN